MVDKGRAFTGVCICVFVDQHGTSTFPSQSSILPFSLIQRYLIQSHSSTMDSDDGLDAADVRATIETIPAKDSGPAAYAQNASDFAVYAFTNTNDGSALPNLVAALEEYDRQQEMERRVQHLREQFGDTSGFQVFAPQSSTMMRRAVSTPYPPSQPQRTVGLLPATLTEDESESDSETVVPTTSGKKKSKSSKKYEKKKKRKDARKEERLVEDMVSLDNDPEESGSVVKHQTDVKTATYGDTTISNPSAGSHTINLDAAIHSKDESDLHDVASVTELQYSPAESVRTEMSLVLGDGSSEEGDSIVASPPPVSRNATIRSVADTPGLLASPANTLVYAANKSSHAEYQPAVTIVSSTTARPLLAPSPDFAHDDSRAQPIMSATNASIVHPANSPISSQAVTPTSETSLTPPDISLVTPETNNSGYFRKQYYPNPKFSANLMPTGTIPVRSISLGRSPLAAAPPITPSTFAWPVSLAPTRQNTPVPPSPTAARGGPTMTIESSASIAFVDMPKSVEPQQPDSLRDAPLNHAYTLYTAQAGNTAGPAKINLSSPTLSADLYSNDLVPIFTAQTFGDFFSSWKALRRAVSRKYGRLIEPEGSSGMVPGSEGLGIHLCPGNKTLQFFRAGVKPMWEDPMCGKGGKIMLSGRSDEVRPVQTS